MSETETVIIDNNLIQAAIITFMKANAALVDWLSNFSAENEIRENQWQGRDFVYPAIRVDLVSQQPIGNPPCHAELAFNVFCYSESDSSQQADKLAGLINAALARKAFTGTGFRSGTVRPQNILGAQRVAERVWEAVCQYQVMLQMGTI